MKKRKIYLNAPITLGFSLICIIALLLNMVSSGKTNVLFFSTYGSSLLSPMTYIRLLGHIFGHANVDHLVSNLLYILLLGPMLEEKYGKRLIIVILSTAAVTGIVHNLLSPNTMLLGASGVVFAFIILASITGNEEGIPVTLIIVALLWIGSEIYTGITTADSVSQLTHIVGGLTGGIIGLAFKK
ncbi:MAG: rhomboid family intramembrane serine protease [Solobacterium sp.]|nr:rhomboid family intramembrane serine protease [Erysipelotrichaceae bacterium]MCI6700803.1 rhomboid family intramembrane serine protease [Solobacterium sp.]MCI7733086.1 rhomboid family intramembrane serine protease [Solobacterium sp.]MDD5843174.1 rhomboid family intramembrane serine protease [Solobacterium sp.]MDD5983041.1 rhomboid family intramembrane serine protease [Solobacterium sp.]